MDSAYPWHARHRPSPVRETTEIGEGAALAVACTQTALPYRDQAALVDDWCRVLPTLRQVRSLYLETKTPQRLFEAACRMPDLESLFIKWSSIQDLAPLTELERLTALYVGSSTRVESIEVLGRMTSLRWLSLENLKRIDDLSPLARLTGLEGLIVQGSMWTTQRVKTLQPLASLQGLRYLGLANLRAGDNTLSPLFALSKLEYVSAARWWPDGEVEELRRRNPALAD